MCEGHVVRGVRTKSSFIVKSTKINSDVDQMQNNYKRIKYTNLGYCTFQLTLFKALTAN